MASRQAELPGDVGAVSLDQLRQPIDPVHARRRDPAEMVEPDVLELQPIGVDAELRRHRSLQGDRDVAEAERPVTGIDERLGDDADRVREVDDPRSGRRMTPRQLGELEDHRHRPQRLGEAARAGRLLTDRAEPQGEGLVEQARGLSADPELDQDEVRAVDGGARVVGQRQAALPLRGG